MSDHGAHSQAGYRHDALLYSGTHDFVARTAPFIRGGVVAREPVMVVTSAEKIDRLRSELGDHAHGVVADTRQPARLWNSAKCATPLRT